MPIYRKIFKYVTYYISFFLLWFAASALIAENFLGFVIISGILILWILGYKYLKSQKPYTFLVSFLMVNIFWLPLLYRTYERVAFIDENGGFEKADGYGSPLAFLIGMVFEQMFFIPLTLIFILGVFVLLSENKGKKL